MLSLEEALVAARPQLQAVWGSPFGYYVQNAIHFAEVLTLESVQAIALYLRERHRALGSTTPILEVGAGSGRLGALLNRSGLLEGVRVVPTDKTPNAGPGDVYTGCSDVPFPVEALEAEAALRTYRPALVLCAWMSCGMDWSPTFRKAGVAEYLLIGDLGDGGTDGMCYSLSYEHPGYTRAVVEEISRELLVIDDALDAPLDEEGYGRACAVAYRRMEEG